MGHRDRSAALSRQHLHRRRQALGGIRLGRQRDQDRRARCSRVDRKNGRCGATNVNPATGRRDLDIPGSLRAAFGHKDLGVYLIVARGRPDRGRRLRCSCRDRCRRRHPRRCVRSPRINLRQRRFMCRGCYFIYEEPTACRSSRSGRERLLPISRRTGAAPIAEPTKPRSVPTWRRRRLAAPVCDVSLVPRNRDIGCAVTGSAILAGSPVQCDFDRAVGERPRTSLRTPGAAATTPSIRRRCSGTSPQPEFKKWRRRPAATAPPKRRQRVGPIAGRSADQRRWENL